MSLREKNTGQITGLSCSVGQNQRLDIQEDTTSPTIIIESLLLTPTIETGDSLQASWWIDASFATNHEIKSHTGGILS